MIGIVGGIGPLAGADLYQKIVAHTKAKTDQDHLPVLLASLPSHIPDRTSYLLGKVEENPAIGLAKVIRLLEDAGATYVGIACNTAHAPAIFDTMQGLLQQQGSSVQLLHLINLTIEEISRKSPGAQKVGLLVTSGSYHTRLYQQPLEQAGYHPVLLSKELQEHLVHDAIFEIKAHAAGEYPDTVIFQLNTAIAELEALGAEAVILGCTEIGMIEHALDFRGLSVYNPNTLLARALIRKLAPEKLKEGA